MIFLLAVLVGCGSNEYEKNEELLREREKLKKENAAQEERIKALNEQLEAEAAEKAEALKAKEANAQELEQMRKEVKTLE